MTVYVSDHYKKEKQSDSVKEGVVLFRSDDFDKHMDDDLVLLNELFSIFYAHAVKYSKILLTEADKQRLKNTRNFYTVIIFVISMFISQSIQYYENTQLTFHVRSLKNQILIDKLGHFANKYGHNATLDDFNDSELFELINENNERIENSDVYINVLVNLKNDIYMLNKKMSSESDVAKVDEGNHFKLHTAFQLNNTKFDAIMNVQNVTDINDLDNLKSTINIRMPNSLDEYNLLVHFFVKVQKRET